MHPANPYYNNPPDFARLAKQYPSFKRFVTSAASGHHSIDFKDPSALRELTRLLLLRDFELKVDLPPDRLCPTLPNRLDYLCHLLELVPYISLKIFAETGKGLRVLDIGTGAVAIYPLLLSALRRQAKATATELDEESLRHAEEAIKGNGLEELFDGDTGKIKLLKATEGEILFPLKRDDAQTNPYTFTMCNPPFYASEEEMIASTDLKALPAHAAPTAASNELLTPGGELSFISQMMVESAQPEMRTRCAWFTSLVGKAGSLNGLVAKLRELEVDNYFIISTRQAHTARWLIGWSFSDIRLPDTLIWKFSASTSRLLPRPNRFDFTAPTNDPGRARSAVLHALAEAGLPSKSIAASDAAMRDPTPPQVLPGSGSQPNLADDKKRVWVISPKAVTWSRAARRQAKRDVVLAAEKLTEALFIAHIHVVDGENVPPDRSASPTRRLDLTSTDNAVKKEHCRIRLDWTRGRDRLMLEGFWAFFTRKMGDYLKGLPRDDT